MLKYYIDEPEPEPKKTFAFLRHSPSNRQNYWDSIVDSDWANGAFVYWPGPWGHSELKWDQYWEEAVQKSPEGLHTLVSPKTLDEDSLADFCEKLPQSWRDKMIYAFYQEPEDNFTSPSQIAEFREIVKRAGEIVRPYGIRNAVELQEWSLNPTNNAYPSGVDNTSRFVDPDHIDHISWSFYEKNLKDRSQEMVGRVRDFMALFPTLTWDMSATGISVPTGTPENYDRRLARAMIANNFLTLAIEEPNCTGFGWFDFPAWGNLDYGVDAPLLSVFQAHISNLNN